MVQMSNEETDIFHNKFIQEVGEQDLQNIIGGINPCPTCAAISKDADKASKEIHSELASIGSHLQDSAKAGLEKRANEFAGLSSAIDKAPGCVDCAKRGRQLEMLKTMPLHT